MGADFPEILEMPACLFRADCLRCQMPSKQLFREMAVRIEEGIFSILFEQKGKEPRGVMPGGT